MPRRERMSSCVEVVHHHVTATTPHEAHCAFVDAVHEDVHVPAGPYRERANVFGCEPHLRVNDLGCNIEICYYICTSNYGPEFSIEYNG